MLGDREVVATLAVADINVARRFYGDTLGLTQVGAAGSEMLVYATGASKLFVYRSHSAGTNKATAATWIVGDDIDELVRGLAARGVSFEYYDFPDTIREGDVHVSGPTRVAWFKDPDGNILSIVNR